MGTGALIALDDRSDVWVDEEALVFVDFEDRAALAAEVTPVATTTHTGPCSKTALFGPSGASARVGGQ
jgi:hypothetical protein